MFEKPRDTIHDDLVCFVRHVRHRNEALDEQAIGRGLQGLGRQQLLLPPPHALRVAAMLDGPHEWLLLSLRLP